MEAMRKRTKQGERKSSGDKRTCLNFCACLDGNPFEGIMWWVFRGMGRVVGDCEVGDCVLVHVRDLTSHADLGFDFVSVSVQSSHSFCRRETVAAVTCWSASITRKQRYAWKYHQSQHFPHAQKDAVHGGVSVLSKLVWAGQDLLRQSRCRPSFE